MFDVVIDTREQVGWSFANSTLIDNLISQKLDTGDYAIAGLEDKLCIERKKSVSELASNLTDDRFTRELERMAKFSYKFLLLEFDHYAIDRYPEGSEIPKYMRDKVKIKAPFIVGSLTKIAINYDIHVILCGNASYAECIAEKIMKRVYEKYNPTKK